MPWSYVPRYVHGYRHGWCLISVIHVSGGDAKVVPEASAKLPLYVSSASWLRVVLHPTLHWLPIPHALALVFLDEMKDDGVDKLERISLLYCRSSTCPCG